MCWEGHGIIEDCVGVEGLRGIAETFNRKCRPEYDIIYTVDFFLKIIHKEE